MKRKSSSKPLRPSKYGAALDILCDKNPTFFVDNNMIRSTKHQTKIHLQNEFLYGVYEKR